MWTRKEIKTKAKEVVKKNYWTAIIVCFLIALLTGEYGTSVIMRVGEDETKNPMYITEQIQELPNELEINKENIIQALDDTQIKVVEAIEANFNSATKSQKYIFKIWDSIQLFQVEETGVGVIICVAAFIALLFTIMIADPLIVAGKRYFIKARESEKTKIEVMGEIFKRGSWLNVAITMLLRNIYTALWYLTIIGGIIKTYEYRMIPFILGENPKTPRKEAFQLSKQLMKGNKWRTFILDMSFFGWNFLSVLTFGLLSILYVNPYNSATMAELYVTLKEENENK